MKENFYLYAIVVTAHYLYGELPVCADNGYEIHAIPVVEGESEEDTINSYVWELCVDTANSYGEPYCDCNNCGESEAHCSCEEPWLDQEDFCDFVERVTAFRAEKYNPSNVYHLLCPGAIKYRDVALRSKLLLTDKIQTVEQAIGRSISKLESLLREAGCVTEAIQQQKQLLASLKEELKGIN